MSWQYQWSPVLLLMHKALRQQERQNCHISDFIDVIVELYE